MGSSSIGKLSPQRKYYLRNKERILAELRVQRKLKANHRINMYRENAKRRGHEWLLDDKVAEAMMRMPCDYCSVPADPFNGIDRKDNAMGYTSENSVPCCILCNWGKGKSLTPEQYVAHCILVAHKRG